MTHREVTAYIGMGSNLRCPRTQLDRALRRIRCSPGLRLLAVSPYYRTAPLEPADLPAGAGPQPDYVNAVAALATRMPAHWLLRRMQALERYQGRERAFRWGPRTLDLDILLYGRRHVQTPELILPHPELHKRAFVLYPLADIAPRLDIPGRGPVVRWLKRCDKTTVRRLPPRSMTGA